MQTKSEANTSALVIEQLKRSKLKFTLENESLNDAISASLKKNLSKTGGKGGGRPDMQFAVQHKGTTWYGFIECKNSSDKMIKPDENGFISNEKKTGELAWNAINGFAVNGAYYYAKNAYKDTEYKNWFIIGACGTDEGSLKISVYVLTKDETFGEAKHYKNFTDFSFLYPENIKETLEEAGNACLSESEKEALRGEIRTIHRCGAYRTEPENARRFQD